MVNHTFGIINVERVEKKMNSAIFNQLISALESLKNLRDPEAHTFLKGVTRTIQSPSYTKSFLDPVYKGLNEFNKHIKTII